MEGRSRPDAGHDRTGHRTLWTAALSAMLVAAAIGFFLWLRAPATPQHDGEIGALAYRSYGQILASGSDDKTIKLWKMPVMRLLHTLAEHASGDTWKPANEGRLKTGQRNEAKQKLLYRIASGGDKRNFTA